MEETESDAGVVYFSRWYRAEDENHFGFRAGLGGGLAVGVIGADAGTYSITAVVDKDDRELRAHLNDSDRFDATMRLLPEIADVIDFGGRPFHPVHCMTGLVNRLRRYTDSRRRPARRRRARRRRCPHVHQPCLRARPVPRAAPSGHGRRRRRATRRPRRRGTAVRSASARARVEPWFHFSVLSDQMRPNVPGAAAPSGGSAAGVQAGGSRRPGLLGRAVGSDGATPSSSTSSLRVVNLLEPPDALWARLPELQRSASESADAAASRRAARPRRPGPSRDDILAVVA